MATTIETMKGTFSGSLRECCEWQARMQAGGASLADAEGRTAIVDDVEFDRDLLDEAVEECAARLYEIEIEESADAHLTGIGATISAEADADELIGEDSWQVPEGCDIEARIWARLVRDELARRIEEDRTERATTTEAERFVAAQIEAGADGSTWSDALEAAAEQAGARRRSVGYQLARLEFSDGSALALCGPGGAWDVAVGSGDCTCWVSAQRGAHHESCR